MLSGIRERDEQLSCEMIEAGVRVFNRSLSDRFGVNGYPAVEELISEIYRAMRTAACSREPA